MLKNITKSVPAIHVIHENQEWTTPLFHELELLGVAFEDWDMSQSIIDISKSAPSGILQPDERFISYEREPICTRNDCWSVSMAGKPRAQNPKWQNCIEFGNIKTSAICTLQEAGLSVPHTIAVSNRDDILDAYDKMPFDDIITKHNRAGKGLGVQLIKSKEAAIEHINSSQYEDSVDGITLLQQYIKPADEVITRVEFIGGEFLYAVNVDTSNGFEFVLLMCDWR